VAPGEENLVKTFEDEIPDYPGLPRGAMEMMDLPPQAVASAGMTDEGVFAAGVDLYLNVVDPRTGKPYHDRPLADVAEGAFHIAAAKCKALATQFSSGCEERATELEAEAKSHLVEAVDNIESCARIWDEPLTGPDGEITSGRKIRKTQEQDEVLARERSAEGDSRHTERLWENAWRLLAATMLGLLDVLLLWKPLLNLSMDGNSGNVFRWAIGLGLAGLQVLAIEWAARTYVNAERSSVDRRGALGDFNRPLKEGFLDPGRKVPEHKDLLEADSRMAHAYRWLVLVATFIGVIGGARVAFLARRAQLESYEAALFGTIIGLLLGGLVVQMARLYCRGNLLGDRLRAEREAIAELDDRIQHARGVVVECRESAAISVETADALVDRAKEIRERTVEDYLVAVRLAWTWFGLPQSNVDSAEFKLLAMPEHADTSTGRGHVRALLNKVNQWLAEPPIASVPEPVAALAAAEEGKPGTALVRNAGPHTPPGGGRNQIHGIRRRIEPPEQPVPPHLWMLVGALTTVAATLVAAFLLPAPDETEALAPAHSMVSGQER
jgi:hypothetical protein